MEAANSRPRPALKIDPRLDKQPSRQGLIPKGRLAALDSMRGIAAYLVTWVHVGGIFTPFAPSSITRTIVEALAVVGNAIGVPTFFVLSGFVIAASTLSVDLSFHEVPRLILRRLVRLAPPYWLSLVIMLAALYLRGFANPAQQSHISVPTILTNCFYLQGLLGFTNINVVFWTLTIEVQFYFIFSVSAALFTFSKRKLPAGAANVIFSCVLMLSCLGSMMAYREFPLDVKMGNCLGYWYQFALGVAAYAILSRRSKSVAIAAIGIILLSLAIGVMQADASTLATVGACMTILMLGYGRALTTALDNFVLRFLGERSYSIYMLHVPIIFMANGLRSRIHPGVTWISWLSYALVLAAILVASDLMFKYVEAPSIGWSKWLKAGGAKRNL